MRRETGGATGRPRKKKEDKAKTGSLNSTREKAYAAQEMKAHVLDQPPAPPGGLGEEGKYMWEVATRELHKQRLLSALDLFNLRAMCIEWECYLKLRTEQIDHSSYYAIKDEKGIVKSWQPHPVHYNATNHLREFNRIANDFGLSPAARGRMGVTTQDNVKTKAAELRKAL